MRWLPILLALPLTACPPSGGDDDDDSDGSGTITYTVDGQTYTEASDVGASLQTGFLGITWNATGTGDLGEDFYGSLTLSSYAGEGSYAPAQRQTDVDAVIEVAGGPGSITYYPVGDGSIEVDTEDGTGATGSFSFTGYDALDQTAQVDISGTFDVVFGTN